MIDSKVLWEQEFASQKGSGLSMRAYCREKGLSYSSMIYWSRRMRIPEQPAEFVEIERSPSEFCFRLEITVAGRTFRLVME